MGLGFDVIVLYWVFQVIFEGVCGDSYIGDIGLDDVIFIIGCKIYDGNFLIVLLFILIVQLVIISLYQCSSVEFNCVKQGFVVCIFSIQVISLLS